MSYEQWLIASKEHSNLCKNFLAEALCAELFNVHFNTLDDPQVYGTFKAAAEHALLVFNTAGWDFMFNEDGQFTGMIT